MHSPAVTALEDTACRSRAASPRKMFGDRYAREKVVINSTHASSPVDSMLADATRGYRSDLRESAEIVVHSRAMQYAKYHDRKNRSANRSPNARFENLIDEPCVKTYEGKCVNNAELFLRTRIARVNEMRCVQSDEWM